MEEIIFMGCVILCELEIVFRYDIIVKSRKILQKGLY